MAVILGLASAIVYGTADFLGGLVTKKAGALPVVVWSHLTTAVVVALAIAVVGAPLPARADLGWGALSGVAGGAGVMLLYRGLAIGRMSVVAPITAVGAATIPVVFGMLVGERPSLVALIGIVVALVAIVLVSGSTHPDAAAVVPLPWWRRPGVAEAVGAGIGFGFFFICLDQASGDSPLWTLLAARSSILVAASVAVVTRTSLRPNRAALPRIAAVGVLDMLANLFYLGALNYGLLSLVAVLVSLYPAATVVLARVVLKERFSGLQLAGLAAAGVGVVLMGLG